MADTKRIAVAIVDNSVIPEIYRPGRTLEPAPRRALAGVHGPGGEPARSGRVQPHHPDRFRSVHPRARALGRRRGGPGPGSGRGRDRGPGQLLGTPAHRLRPGRKRPCPPGRAARDRLDPDPPGEVERSPRSGGRDGLHLLQSTTTRFSTCRPASRSWPRAKPAPSRPSGWGTSPSGACRATRRSTFPTGPAVHPRPHRLRIQGPGGPPRGPGAAPQGLRAHPPASSGPSWEPDVLPGETVDLA